MDAHKLESLPHPPGVVGSLRAGFDTVSSHVILILLPIALDLFLWLGPRLSVDGLISPFVKLIFSQARTALTSSSDLKRFTDFQSAFIELIQHFNLLSLIGKLQTFAIGIWSLLAQNMPTKTPFDSQDVVQVTSVLGF